MNREEDYLALHVEEDMNYKEAYLDMLNLSVEDAENILAIYALLLILKMGA